MTTLFRWTDHVLPPGLLSARPAVAAVPVGALYPATDTSIIYRSDGTAWQTWATITGTGGGATDLNSLTDVVVASETLQDVLIWDGTEWTNWQLHLDYASDVTITSPSTGEVLTYNGTHWVNQAGGSGGTASGTTFTPTGGLSSTDVQAALAELDTEKAPLASPVLTGNPTAPTPSPGDADTSIATTAFVAAAILAGGGYTDEAARDAIGAALVAGANMTITVNDAGDTITLAAADTNTTDPEVVRDTIGAALVAGANVTITVNDAGDTITVAVTGLDDSVVAPVAPNDQTGTAYTFVLADGRRLVTASNAAAQTFTVPPNSAVAYPLGTVLSIVQKGAGQVTLAQGAGVTLQSAHGLKTSAQWAMVSLTKILTDTWAVSGDTIT